MMILCGSRAAGRNAHKMQGIVIVDGTRMFLVFAHLVAYSAWPIARVTPEDRPYACLASAIFLRVVADWHADRVRGSMGDR